MHYALNADFVQHSWVYLLYFGNCINKWYDSIQAMLECWNSSYVHTVSEIWSWIHSPGNFEAVTGCLSANFPTANLQFFPKVCLYTIPKTNIEPQFHGGLVEDDFFFSMGWIFRFQPLFFGGVYIPEMFSAHFFSQPWRCFLFLTPTFLEELF